MPDKGKYNKHRDLGLCGDCGKNPSIERSRCSDCRTVIKSRLDQLKATVISAYGGKCSCCGEDTLAFLTIDHINNNGSKHRKEMNSHNVYRWLRQNNYPRGDFQVLCFNCNLGRRINGNICPHQS